MAERGESPDDILVSERETRSRYRSLLSDLQGTSFSIRHGKTYDSEITLAHKKREEVSHVFSLSLFYWVFFFFKKKSRCCDLCVVVYIQKL